MAKHRTHSIEFKRQVAQDFIAGETLHGLAKRHDISRNLIRIGVKKLEAWAFDEDARAADLQMSIICGQRLNSKSRCSTFPRTWKYCRLACSPSEPTPNRNGCNGCKCCASLYSLSAVAK